MSASDGYGVRHSVALHDGYAPPGYVSSGYGIPDNAVSRDGYEPRRVEDYYGGHSVPPSYTSSSPPTTQTSGYATQPTSGYAPRSHDGYGSQPSSGYGSQPVSGYAPRSHDGYGSQSSSGYGSQPVSGYAPPSHDGYGPTPSSGYPPVSEIPPSYAPSGYAPPGGNSGYPPVSESPPVYAPPGYPPVSESPPMYAPPGYEPPRFTSSAPGHFNGSQPYAPRGYAVAGRVADNEDIGYGAIKGNKVKLTASPGMFFGKGGAKGKGEQKGKGKGGPLGKINRPVQGKGFPSWGDKGLLTFGKGKCGAGDKGRINIKSNIVKSKENKPAHGVVKHVGKVKATSAKVKATPAPHVKPQEVEPVDWRTKMCFKFQQEGKCEYGDKCRYRHTPLQTPRPVGKISVKPVVPMNAMDVETKKDAKVKQIKSEPSGATPRTWGYKLPMNVPKDVPEEPKDVPEEPKDIPEEPMDVSEESKDIPGEPMDVPQDNLCITEEVLTEDDLLPEGDVFEDEGYCNEWSTRSDSSVSSVNLPDLVAVKAELPEGDVTEDEDYCGERLMRSDSSVDSVDLPDLVPVVKPEPSPTSKDIKCKRAIVAHKRAMLRSVFKTIVKKAIKAKKQSV